MKNNLDGPQTTTLPEEPLLSRNEMDRNQAATVDEYQ